MRTPDRSVTHERIRCHATLELYAVLCFPACNIMAQLTGPRLVSCREIVRESSRRAVKPCFKSFLCEGRETPYAYALNSKTPQEKTLAPTRCRITAVETGLTLFSSSTTVSTAEARHWRPFRRTDIIRRRTAFRRDDQQMELHLAKLRDRSRLNPINDLQAVLAKPHRR